MTGAPALIVARNLGLGIVIVSVSIGFAIYRRKD